MQRRPGDRACLLAYADVYQDCYVMDSTCVEQVSSLFTDAAQEIGQAANMRTRLAELGIHVTVKVERNTAPGYVRLDGLGSPSYGVPSEILDAVARLRGRAAAEEELRYVLRESVYQPMLIGRELGRHQLAVVGFPTNAGVTWCVASQAYDPAEELYDQALRARKYASFHRAVGIAEQRANQGFGQG